ncbi:MAG: glycosyltransferase [Cyclobacteriaceae bacterium]
MSTTPLVSVICLCHNHARFVEAAIRSVWSQTYQNVELIVVDDGSSDDSADIIKKTIEGSAATFIELKENIGNCKAFNIGFKQSKGAFVIDLAADDMLLPPRIELGINDFLNSSEKAGVHFSDVFLANESGQIIKTMYERDQSGQLLEEIPVDDIYSNLISKYFISAPSMMIRREVMEELKGYDESLAYEDFDFWIRSARRHHYIFNKAPLVKKRMVSGSHAKSQRKPFNRHQKSTLAVCRKIFDLNKKPEEYDQLITRCKYEIRQCVMTLNFGLAFKYWKLSLKSRAAQRRLSSSSSIEI